MTTAIKTVFSEEFEIPVIIDEQKIDFEFIVHGYASYYLFGKNREYFKKDIKQMLKHYKNNHLIYKSEYKDTYKLNELFFVEDGKDKIVALLEHLLNIIIELGKHYDFSVISLHSRYGVIKANNI